MFQSILFLASIKGGVYGKIGGFFWHRYLGQAEGLQPAGKFISLNAFNYGLQNQSQ